MGFTKNQFYGDRTFSFSNLPACQVSMDYETDILDSLHLHKVLISSAIKRKSEFIAGRICAQEAIKKVIGMNPEFLPIGENGSPVWPKGIVGSITHTDSFASAVVANSSEVKSLGIDAEKWIDEKRMRTVKHFVATPKEIKRAEADPSLSGKEVFTLLFSAKESIYKCFYPFLGSALSFLDVEISFKDIGANRFQYKFLKNFSSGFPKGYEGMGWSKYDKHRIYTLVNL